MVIRVIHKEIWVPIMMIEHTIFARSNTILPIIMRVLKLQHYENRFSENYTRSRWSSKQILFDQMCFCSIIWSVTDRINDPAYLDTSYNSYLEMSLETSLQLDLIKCNLVRLKILSRSSPANGPLKITLNQNLKLKS